MTHTDAPRTEGLVLMTDGTLTQTRWCREPKGYKSKDVTARAVEFLYDDLVLDAGVTVRSLFLLLQACPALVTVFRRAYAAELLDEALGAVPSGDISGGIDPQEVEYSAVYRSLSRHSVTKRLGGLNELSFHGVGPVATEDVVHHGHVICKAGRREYYAFSLTHVRHLLDLPLRFDTEVVLSEADFGVPEYWTKSEVLNTDELKLGEFIHAVLDELSVHGVGENRDAFSESLAAQIADIEQNGMTNTRPLSEVLDEFRTKLAD